MKKGCDDQDGQDLCRNAVDHINNFDNNDPGCKTFFLPKCFPAWIIIIKIVNVMNSIPAQALATTFGFHILSLQSFSHLGHNFLQLGCCGWDFTSFLEINACSYWYHFLQVEQKILNHQVWQYLIVGIVKENHGCPKKCPKKQPKNNNIANKLIYSNI